MAVYLHCGICKASVKVGTKKCSKCQQIFPKNKKYRVVVVVAGKRKTKMVHNLELAREIETELKSKINRKEYNIFNKPIPTLDEVWEKYLPFIMENKKTFRDDVYNYNKHLKSTFGSLRLDRISPFIIEKFMLEMKKKENCRGKSYAPATIKHQLILLTRLYSIAEKWGLYDGDNPTTKVKKPKLNNRITEFLKEAELRRLHIVLAEWENKMSSSFVLFLLYTGLRRGELFKLTWDDVDLKRKIINLRSPKGKEDTSLPLSPEAIDVLKNMPKEFESKWIFYGKNGNQRKDFKGAWHRIRAKADLPKNFRLHGLRHHFASSLVSAGIDLFTVQKLLTHKDAGTTQRYAHLSDQKLRDAINLSDKLQTIKQDVDIIPMEVIK